MTPFNIAGRPVGPGAPVYIVAELSANHDQSFDQAVKLVHAAHEAGVDAVKLQTYRPDTITLNCESEHFQLPEGTLWAGRTLYQLYEEAFTPWEWQPKLKELAQELGLHCFSSPFDEEAVDFLEAMDVPAYKIASFELVDLPLIARAAATGKPLIMSTGMASLAEIDEALATASGAGCHELALLVCSSAYPAPPESIRLSRIPFLEGHCGRPIGLSDHTLDLAVPLTAVGLGARIIEKHLCLSRGLPGPDRAFSLEPQEFRVLVQAVRTAEAALGAPEFGVSPSEEKSRQWRRSLFVVRDIGTGERFTTANVRSVRPAAGLHTRHFDRVLGCRATRAIAAGTPLAWDLIDDLRREDGATS